MSSGATERTESMQMATEIAVISGYSPRPRGVRRCRIRPAAMNASNESNFKIPLCLPFISDRISTAIKQCLRQAQLENDAFLVNIPNRNIKQRLVRNRLYDRACPSPSCVVCPYGTVGDCTKTGVVYQIECLDCHAIYIGETGRPLRVRLNEHLASKRRQSLVSPLGKHRREDHDGVDFNVMCIILACEKEISARKALEAGWILTRNPRMNSRNEQISVMSDLMPFLPSCNL